MQLGITMRINGATPQLSMDEVLEAERLGYESVWSGEAWGTDAVSPVAWVLARTTRIKAGTAIMQMQARTPSCAAMTAMTLNALSGGRFLLGVGPSGPPSVGSGSSPPRGVLGSRGSPGAWLGRGSTGVSRPPATVPLGTEV